MALLFTASESPLSSKKKRETARRHTDIEPLSGLDVTHVTSAQISLARAYLLAIPGCKARKQSPSWPDATAWEGRATLSGQYSLCHDRYSCGFVDQLLLGKAFPF